ncbi:IS5 family transposase [Streptomyces niveus]|uniref:IS5 family transposase n=1 Tax=Streptomyces niveus TaxID=193462 RepID=UPI003B5B1DAC
MSLTDAQWARIEPLLPDRAPKRGGRWRDHRQVIDAIAFKFRTGTPWMDLPEHFGSWKGAHNRLRKWAAGGTWEKVFTVLLAQADAEGDLDWIVAVDSTIVRAHQHAAGARQKGPRRRAGPSCPWTLARRLNHQDPPRCRQPLSPAPIVLTPGRAGDAPAFPQVMARLRVPGPVGRPRTTPDVVLVDKAYSSRAIRTHLRRRGIRAVIPQPADQAADRKRLGRPAGRPGADLRPRRLQAAQHGRAVHQQAQAVARPGHPIRQDRRHLPRRTPRRGHLHLVR